MASVELEKVLIDNVVYEDGEGKEDGGVKDIKDSRTAWITCVCAVFDQLFINGLINVYGVFYVEFLKEFGTSKAKAAWLGSLTYGIMKLFAPVVSVLVRRYTNRMSMITGCAFCAVSVLSTSFVTNIDVMFVTFPFLYGIGFSLVINPAMVVANGYFDKHIGLATGLVCAGSSLGSITLAPVCQRLVDTVGWRMTFRYLTGAYIALCFLNLLIKPLPRGSQRPIDNISQPVIRVLIEDLKLWKNRVFLLWAVATAFVMFGYFIPNVHLVSYAMDQGISADTAAYLLMALGCATTIGRILSGKIVQYGFLNRLHLHQLTMIITGTAFMILPCIESFAGLLAYSIVLGLVDGCYVVLLPILTSSLIGADKAVLAWCFMSCVCSLTFSLGPPVSGFLYDTTGNYNVAFHIAGIPVILGAVILFFVPWAQRTSTTTNVMRVISMEAEDHPKASAGSSPSGSSDETLHLSIPETGTLPYAGMPCFIDPYFGSSKQESSLAEYYGRKQDETKKHVAGVQPTGGSVPDDCTFEFGHDTHEEQANAMPHNSAPTFDAIGNIGSSQFISIPRRGYPFIDGYLEELRKAVYRTRTLQCSSGLVPPPSPEAGNTETPPAAAHLSSVSSLPASSMTSSVDRLLQEHIDLFLATIASRRVSDMSMSSGPSRSASRSFKGSEEPSKACNRTPSNRSTQSRTTANCALALAGAQNEPRSRSVNSRGSLNRTVDLSLSGTHSSGFVPSAVLATAGANQQMPVESHSRTSDASGDGTQSSSLSRLRKTSSTSTGTGFVELDVFSHLFKDEES
ncbi:monocarboxylate transporter 13-like [Haliotis cracherodii]|uniref:monocarboxylate transporter 13-like n=1 Tax=Haliotis cracherodii TaxID=6455 RepID=UPI0039E7D7E6